MNNIYIRCLKCEKVFEVEKNLIPSTGREVKCGNCNEIWFYKFSNLGLKNIDEILNKYPGDIPKDVENLILNAERKG